MINQTTLQELPESNWYSFTLDCGHTVYSRVRLKLPVSHQMHFVRCPVGPHQPIDWRLINDVKAVTDEHVSNVLSGSSFILPKRILRCNGYSDKWEYGAVTSRKITPSGDPFPYSSKNRDY